MAQSSEMQDDVDCHAGDHCWLDCDTDSAVVVSFLQQGEKEYSLVPLLQLISTATKLAYFLPLSGLPPPVVSKSSLYTLHCAFLI